MLILMGTNLLFGVIMVTSLLSRAGIFVSVGNGPDLTPSNDMHTQKKKSHYKAKAAKNRTYFAFVSASPNPRTGCRRESSECYSGVSNTLGLL